MQGKKPRTLRELKSRINRLPGVREEMRANLVRKLALGEPLFPGLIGYENTVIPGLVNALLCGHNIIILGERGQGKSRIIRQMTGFLDEEIPVIEGCPINDDPFAPVCSNCRRMAHELGDNLPIDYVRRDRRLIEKLATSDVSTADLIGEIDPIKIAEGRTLDDESSIHFGLIPRANRGIFAINELPDLAEKLQVAFFNIMEEGDFQIKGFPLRLPLDVLVIATANPEDYTSRGRIITPLKDRFDVQLRTHYPAKREDEIDIMVQEGNPPVLNGIEVKVPSFINQILSEMTLQARHSTEINQHSGVSCRISIRGFETIIGSAIARCLATNELVAVPRITDLESMYPSMRGKLELEYEVEEKKIDQVLEALKSSALKTVFDEHFNIENLTSVIKAFSNGMSAEVSRILPSSEYLDGFTVIPGLKEAVQSLADPDVPAEAASAIEFILEGLHLSKKLNREVQEKGAVYK